MLAPLCAALPSLARRPPNSLLPRGTLPASQQITVLNPTEAPGRVLSSLRGEAPAERIARPSPRAGSDAGSGSSRALRPNEEEPRDTRHPPRRHRVGPPPVVRFSLAGLDHLRLPAVLGKQRLRVIGAEAAGSTAAGEGP